MSIKKYIIIFIAGAFQLAGLSTTYLPQTIDHQLRNAEGVVIGNYLGKNYKRLRDGKVVTELMFSLKKIAGLNQNQIANPNVFKVTVPGGKWNGIVFQVNGIPEFTKNEKVALILDKKPYGYTLKNLALSKFSIKKTREGSFIKSDIFSDRPGIGIMKLKNFEELISRNLGSPLRLIGRRAGLIYKGDQDPLLKDIKGKSKRSPASQQASIEDERKVDSFWLIIILGFLGGLVAVSVRRNSE